MPPKKDKKKAKQKQDDYWDTEFQQDAATLDVTTATAEPEQPEAAEPTAVTADPVMDNLSEEFGGLMAAIKKSKGKKGKKQQPVDMVDANEELQAMEVEATSVTADQNGDAGDTAEKEDEEQGGGEFRVKTKKEKEKEKKEKEKAKKKAQADKKKGASAPAPEPEPEPAAEPPTEEGTAEPEEDEGAEETTAGGKGKKKKKKPAAKKEEPPAAAAASKARKGPNLQALQKRLAAQQAAEEARIKAEEEEKARIAEEERRIAEEEARKEEEKRLKKEREKAKREDLRKKGLLLSKKQKEQQRLAALRHEQLLASGSISVAGLSGEQGEGQKAKRPVYGNKRKGKKENDKAAAATTNVEEKLAVESVSEPPKSKAGKSKVAAPVEAEPAFEEVADSWEEAAADSWEDKIDEDGNIVEKPQSEVPEAVNGDQDDEEDEDEDEEEDEEEDSDDDSDDDSEPRQSAVQLAAQKKKAEAAARREEVHKEALAARSKDNLRSPICCILGHVDTGKTKLLDKIRQTNVQEGEAGGITQQIGATYFPLDAIKMKTEVVNRDGSFDFRIPGLLIIDTPGHESFTNLRSRGSSLCNIAILVIDIMHGLEPQTLESIQLLRNRKTPFIVALNKIDRIYGWNPTPNGAFQESLAKQNKAAQQEFKSRCDQAIVALQEQGLNSALYYENKNLGRNVSIVPTSAHTGEGIPDMLKLLVSLTQDRMTDKLMYLSELECTVLEVKVIEGLGTTIDVILSNGVLHESDRIVLCGLDGPIITNIRALLTPEPMKEMRVKSAYVHHKEVKAALGVKITAQNLGSAIAGSRLLVVGPDDDEDDLAEEVMTDLHSLLERVEHVSKGVQVQASTLGSLEALLEFLKQSKIPVAGINIGPVHRKDIMRCATMLERAPEYAVLLCFDVKVDKEAEELATEMNVKIFSANIIYHLFDSFTAYQQQLLEQKKKEAAGSAVFPCVLHISQIFRSRDPIILGVDVMEGSIRIGTPLAVVKSNEATQQRQVYQLGKIVSMEQNHKALDIVKKGQSGAGVAIKIEGATQQLFGRHIDENDLLYSYITRHSIDTLKTEAMRAEVSKEEWALIVKLKAVFALS